VVDPRTKLSWFDKNCPGQTGSVRQLFIDAVSFSLLLIVYFLHEPQLKPYHDPPQATTTSQPTEASTSWEDAVLGLTEDAVMPVHPSLEAEVDNYLVHTAQPTTLINFWQVRDPFLILT
jgi:hypothetical protein